ncbi:hypothetical protein DID74_02150 [Candidatus Marinamargulisbacteria bacterium SCGC AG-333-B06]|nr:hypothetical protein DID74_02150 [Candidatus Marinamargulisbacteria bacterium SCGC AG-333-B06]
MMSLSIVPGVFFVVLIVLSSLDKVPEKRFEKSPQSNKKIFSSELPFSMLDQKESDQNTIYNYITSKYKKVSIEDAKKIAQNLVNYGKKYNIDPKFAAAVIARESGFKKDAVSVTGAKGLGQIKDFNYKDLNITDPFNINQNVDGTIRYLKKMIKKWNDNQDEIVVKRDNSEPGVVKQTVSKDDHLKLALASYFKGFTAVKKTGVDPKTKRYVGDIVTYYKDIVKYEEN